MQGEREDIDYQPSTLSTETTWAKTLESILPSLGTPCPMSPSLINLSQMPVEFHEHSDFMTYCLL